MNAWARALEINVSRGATLPTAKLCFGMTTDIDCQIGARLRARRRLLGLSQTVLGDAIGVRFQQIQKYECAANTISAVRLWALALRLGVGIDYFFDGLRNDAQHRLDPLVVALQPALQAKP